MGRLSRSKSRTRLQSAADDATQAVLKKLGKAIRNGRTEQRLTQRQAGQKAGLSRSEWSGLELGRKSATLRSLNRAAYALGSEVNVYLSAVSAADQPRDAVHLRNQELVLRTARRGDWRGVAEQALDGELTRSRHGDVVLDRQRGAGDGVAAGAAAPREVSLVEVVDWVADVGESVRDFDRRLAALDRWAVARMRGEGPLPTTSGCWLLRATSRNRRLVNEHRLFFRGRFPGSGRAWLAALTTPTAPLPAEPALLWANVDGTRIFAARLGSD
jgi:transcriptional regulator with XRE-family HTH domain